MNGAPESALMRFAYRQEHSIRKNLKDILLTIFGCLAFAAIDSYTTDISPRIFPVSFAAGFSYACLIRFSWKALPAMLVGLVTGHLLVEKFLVWPFVDVLSLLISLSAVYLALRVLWKTEFTFRSLQDLIVPFILGSLLIGALYAILVTTVDMGLPSYPSPEQVGELHEKIFAVLAGLILFTPGICLSFDRTYFLTSNRGKPTEAIIAILCLAAFSWFAVTESMLKQTDAILLSIIVYSILVWIALRFGLRFTSLTISFGSVGILAVMLLITRGKPLDLPLSIHVHYITLLACGTTCLIIGVLKDCSSNAELRAKLAEGAADFCPWEFTYEGGLVFLSAPMARRLGFEAGRPLPLESWIATVHPDHHGEFASRITEGAMHPLGSFNVRFLSRDGLAKEWFWTKSIGVILKTAPNRQPLEAIGIIVDINAEIDAEESRIAALQKQAELTELRTQLNPHFLFNCLNSIRALIRKDVDRARDMITTLSGLLRYLLQEHSGNFDTVEAEMSVVEKYLRLEQIRFGARLQVEFKIDPDALKCMIPSMLILTLVENAVKHGISRLEPGGFIRVEFSLDTGALVILVENSGTYNESENGLGLQNTRRRIRLILGDAASFEIKQSSPNVVTARVQLPRDLPDAGNLTASNQ